MCTYCAGNPSLQPQIAVGWWEGLHDKSLVPPFPEFFNRHSVASVSTTKLYFEETKWLVGC